MRRQGVKVLVDKMSVEKESILNLSAYLDFLIKSSNIIRKDCQMDKDELSILHDLLDTLEYLVKMDLEKSVHENTHQDM